jgi:hypothetical protein
VILPLGGGFNIYIYIYILKTIKFPLRLPLDAKLIKENQGVEEYQFPNAILISLNSFRYTEHTPDHNSICLYQLTISDQYIYIFVY